MNLLVTAAIAAHNRIRRQLQFGVLFGCALCAQADVIFTNFGPGFAFNQVGGVFVGNSNPGISNQVIGMQFVPTSSGEVTNIILGLGEFQAGATHLASVYLDMDAAGQPGSTLERIDLPVTSLAPTLSTFTSLTHPGLVAGTPYWVVATASVTSGPLNYLLYWGTSPTGDTGETAYCQNPNTAPVCGPNGPWRTDIPIGREAFQVNGAVPEPATAVFVAAGLLIMGLTRRKS